MKTIQLLSVLIALAVSFVACSGKSDQSAPVNPVGPVIMASDGSNTIPAASLDQAVEYEPYISDSLTVSFEGTKIRMFNTSGGTRLVEGKLIIWDIDWNVKAWNPDSTEVDLVAISNAPEWHPVKGYIGLRLNLTIYCNLWPDLWWNGPDIGTNTGFGDEYLVGRMLRYGKREDGRTYQGGKSGDTRGLSSCPVDNLNIRMQYIVHAGWRNTDRDTWTLQYNNFPLPENTEIHKTSIYGVRVIYHPIVSESSYMESETAWLNGLLSHVSLSSIPMPVSVTGQKEYDRGSAEWSPVIGEALVVPPDTTKTSLDLMLFNRALKKLRDEYPHGVGLKVNTPIQGYHTYVIRVGLMSRTMEKTYSESAPGIYTSVDQIGLGYVGQPWSVFLYNRDGRTGRDYGHGMPNGFGSQTLTHEIGHNLGLVHTEDVSDYPGYPSELNEDAFLVESQPFGPYYEVWKLDAFHTKPLMSAGFGNVRRLWLSEYNWNNILDFFDRETSSVSARVVAGGDQMWICNGEH